MKIKTTVAALILALGSSLTLAGPPHGRGSMLDELDLTDAQREQIKEIRASGGGRDEIHAVLTSEQQEKAQELRDERRSGRKDRAEHMREKLDLTDEQVEQMRGIFDKGGSREEIRAVLTEEQQEKFDTMKKNRKGGHRGGGQQRNSAPE